MFKYYILTSGSLRCLARHFRVFKPTEAVVVINTKDEEYELAATEFCKQYSIEYHVTKSDGTPATGKNAVIDTFLASDNEYMVQVDGDDFITPFGRNLWRTVANGDNPPDIICLSNQLSMVRYDLSVFEGQIDSNTVQRNFIPPEHVGPQKPSTRDFRFSLERDLLPIAEIFETRYHIKDRDLCMELAKARIEIDMVCNDYGERDDTFNRIVFYSRHGAAYTAFDNTLTIGEDTVQYYKLKRYAADGLIDMKLYDEGLGRTYIYMEDTTGVVSVNRDTQLTKEEAQEIEGKRWRWLVPLRDELNKIKDNLPRTRLTFIEEPYYEINKE
jgi:hypothetical protein